MPAPASSCLLPGWVLPLGRSSIRDRVVWTWGAGTGGCLGHGVRQRRSKRTRLGKGAFWRVCDGHCGLSAGRFTRWWRLWTASCGPLLRHSSASETLVHWGTATRSDPGAGGCLEVRRGLLSPAATMTVMVEAGDNHSMAATLEGDVYTWDMPTCSTSSCPRVSPHHMQGARVCM